MEELQLIVAHGVFKGTEGREKVFEGEAPHSVAIVLCGGEVEVRDGTEVVRVFARHEIDDFLCDVVRRKGWWHRDGKLILVGLAIFSVEGKLAADWFVLFHEDAGLLTHPAVETVHDIAATRLVGAEYTGEVFAGRKPGGVGYFAELQAVLHGLCEVEAQLALSRLHSGEFWQATLTLQIEEGLAMAPGRKLIENTASAGGLLQREVSHVGDQEDELLLVVGASVRHGGRLHNDDAGVSGCLFGNRPGAVGDAVVWNVNPAALSDVCSGWFGGLNLVGKVFRHLDWDVVLTNRGGRRLILYSSSAPLHRNVQCIDDRYPWRPGFRFCGSNQGIGF